MSDFNNDPLKRLAKQFEDTRKALKPLLDSIEKIQALAPDLANLNSVDAFIKNQRNKVWEETTDATRRTAYDEEILKLKSENATLRKAVSNLMEQADINGDDAKRYKREAEQAKRGHDALKQEVRRLQERLETIQKVAHDAL